jgi:pimeloyl-ACP methyl ester carboxylesterase
MVEPAEADGHGDSDRERAMTIDFEHVVDDLRTLVDIAVAEHPGLPVVVIGHSMGGLLSARFAARYPDQLAGIVFPRGTFLVLIDRSLLDEQAGRVPQILLDDIDDGLRAVLGL